MDRVSTQVLIVGAGPAGLATGIGLAMRGVDFVIVDALEAAQNTSRAAVVHSGTLQSLRHLGVADRMIAQGIKVPHFRARDRDEVLFQTDFSVLRVPDPFALMIPQDETEAIMTARLAELGHHVRRPVRLRGHARVGDGVCATCEGADGAFTVAARYIVGADGEKSVVRQGAGIGFPGDSYGSFVLADVRMDWPIDRTEVSLFFSVAGTLVVAPMSQDRFRVVAQMADAPPEPSVADMQRIIDARGPRTGARIREVLWGSRFQVHHKLADRLSDGPVVLVGDAAHVHSPAGGQGMNLGLRDAALLAQAIAEALDSGTDASIQAYARARRVQAAKVLRMTDLLTRVATRTSPPLRWARNRLIAGASHVPALRRAAARTLAGYDQGAATET